MDRSRAGIAGAFLTGLQTPSQASQSEANESIVSERTESALASQFGDLNMDIELKAEKAYCEAIIEKKEPPRDSPLITGEENIDQFEDRLEEGFW